MELTPELAELVGAIVGDGHVRVDRIRPAYQIYIFGHKTEDAEYLIHLKELILKIFKTEMNFRTRKEENTAMLSKNSKQIVMILYKRFGIFGNKTNDCGIPEEIMESEQTVKKSFLRGFFDTDGSIYKLKFGIQMAFCNRALPLLRSARGILVSLGYSPSKVSGYNFYLTRRDDLRKYCQEIRFGNPKHFGRAKGFGIV